MQPLSLKPSFLFLLVLALLILGWLSFSPSSTGAAVIFDDDTIVTKTPAFGVGKHRIYQHVEAGKPCGRKAFLLQEGACRQWAVCPQGYECRGPKKGSRSAYCYCEKVS